MEKPVVMPLQNIDPENILFDAGGKTNIENKTTSSGTIQFGKHPISYSEYRKAFDIVFQNIKEGNSYLLNLTFPTRIETNLSLKEVFYLSRAKYRLLYDDNFVLFSPETFIKIKDGKIYSFPMKGTIDAAIDNAEEIILKDEKETAEHITIVDLIRNDLGIVADNIMVDKFRYIDKIKTWDKTLLQVSSVISGELSAGYHKIIGEILFALLPAGSISGAPKKKTVEIIREAEKIKRGYYTGVFGIFDGNDLDSAVMIRYIEKIGEKYFYRSGGGITHMSLPELEYQELIDKVYLPVI